MKTYLSALALLSVATLLPPPALAQDFKPGLYQVSSKVSGNNQIGDMLKQQKEVMAKMTPEQRQQMADLPSMMEKMMDGMSPAQRDNMKAAMGKQAGAMEAMQSMQMTTNADGSTSMKMCLTQDMINQQKQTGNFSGQQGACTHSNGKMSGGVMKISYTCTQPPSKGEGELRMTGPNSYTTRMRMVSTDPANKQTMAVEASSVWLGASCGSVKPMDARAFKQ
ncbi:DUF3617 domain-containing protein [Massilia sp. TSP1-1-2]|uniref:DUF3617 domain-containing protein n=1 Tax=Massilia sp. TSP1-1-2 TaxID=2804649 RepID=UPI003CEAC7DC